jgi:uncharacterized protein with NAD-binding domain and iron-sulfur cluster
MGCYENAFRLMRECYNELNRDPRSYRIADWRDAFFPAPLIGLVDPSADGKLRTFLSYFPPGDGLPGDPFTEEDPHTVTSYLARTVSLLRMLLMTVNAEVEANAGRRKSHAGINGTGVSPNPAAGSLRLLRLGVVAINAGLIEAVGVLDLALRKSSVDTKRICIILQGISHATRRCLDDFVDDYPELSFIWQTIDLAVTSMLGILRFGLISDPRGFDAINKYDFREWLRLNGASERTIDSPLVRSGYDILFAYEDGDPLRPRCAAGVMLRGSLRMLFGSRGAIFWKMRAGMGDIVFAPFYQVLKRRGVSIRFFHRLTALRVAEHTTPAGSSRYVPALEFDVQARTRDGEYYPLVEVNGLPCWPSTPDYSQLIDGERLSRDHVDFESHWHRTRFARKELRASVDFDVVVLAVGLGAIPEICSELIRRDTRWRTMVQRLKTIETQAFQIWLRKPMHVLGWNNPPVSLSAYVHPFETWADMGHLASEENWKNRPRAIAYFCSPLKGSKHSSEASEKYATRRNQLVRKNAIYFLNGYIGHLWPHAASDGRFKWQILVDWREQTSGKRSWERSKGEARFDSQYWRANVNPTDRYVLSLPGTQPCRISPLDNSIENLCVAGDWTACGLDSGCVESAIISGRLAAHAISSKPALKDIVGYDHP